MDDVFLKAFHGGLGDCIQFSTLPEEFSKQQGRKTYILESAPFRNPEIYDLVWGKNPYVEGKKEGKWNAGDLPGLYSNVLGNAIQNWEKLHGLEPVNTLPKIYYEPEIHSDVKDIFIVDFTSISIDYDQQELKNILEKVKTEYPDKKFVSVQFSKQVSDGKHNDYDVGLDGCLRVHPTESLWLKTGKNTDKIAIQSSTVPRANGRASGLVLQSVFLVVLAHSAMLV